MLLVDMSNKQTAVEWLIERLEINNSVSSSGEFWNILKSRAKAMEKEQMIKFAQIVLDKAECSHTGMVYLEADIEDIYNETYKQQDNEDNN